MRGRRGRRRGNRGGRNELVDPVGHGDRDQADNGYKGLAVWC